jgi:hypothetical protein
LRNSFPAAARSWHPPDIKEAIDMHSHQTTTFPLADWYPAQRLFRALDGVLDGAIQWFHESRAERGPDAAGLVLSRGLRHDVGAIDGRPPQPRATADQPQPQTLEAVWLRHL